MTPFEEALIEEALRGTKILTITDDVGPEEMARFHNEMNNRYREIFEREKPCALYGAFWFGAIVDGEPNSKFLYVRLPQDDEQRLAVLKQAQSKFVPVGAGWYTTKRVRAQLFPTAEMVPEGWDWASQTIIRNMRGFTNHLETMLRASMSRVIWN